ncbi:hypothetical protein PoB_006889700 [Plakobranchus ocellatus]|uniref:Uncharacterized protein n=1 Tax=Plakobranchus ocellatus TaxID=259542 RepID=A0AAV4DDQ1_9GAST|nr:hypothetical protein PoB_006889700 [Plakobranchus ocellatus]
MLKEFNYYGTVPLGLTPSVTWIKHRLKHSVAQQTLKRWSSSPQRSRNNINTTTTTNNNSNNNKSRKRRRTTITKEQHSKNINKKPPKKTSKHLGDIQVFEARLVSIF